MGNHRMITYAKDVEIITGKSKRTAYSILNKIKKKHNKNPEQYVTISELCEFLGLCEEKVKQILH